MLFCNSLWWKIFPFYNLCSPNYWRQVTKHCIPLITKLMGLTAKTHKTSRIIIKPFNHIFFGTFIHPGSNPSSVLLLYNSSIILISKTGSMHCSSLLVYLKAPSISLKRLRHIYSYHWKRIHETYLFLYCTTNCFVRVCLPRKPCTTNTQLTSGTQIRLLVLSTVCLSEE